ncbi:MAG: hypothetical protein M3Z57_06795, partial [Candidatus Dormibacteraeota bacterium]|nr:hypothetical protein [Candidatus Dormibacteraeota bacterium]
MRKPVRVGAVAVTAAAVLWAMTPLSAGADSLIGEPFTGATVSNANLLEGGTKATPPAFIPCLTASTNTAQTPIQGCPSGQPAIPAGGDAVGSGALRLTDNSGGEATFVIDNEARPFTAGLTVDFDMYMYDTSSGSPADGIVFFVADGSASVTQPGAGGGSLGYGTFGVTPGVAGGYVGVGFDEFGNYENSAFDGTGCPVSLPPVGPNQVGIRGPGSGTAGYCLLAASGTLSSSLSNPTATSRTTANTKRHVRILIDPPGSASPKVTV